MRERLQRYLPILLVAVALQVLAPVLAFWAAGSPVDDNAPELAGICHDSAGTAQDNPSNDRRAHDGVCAICCFTHAAAPVDGSRSAAAAIFEFRFQLLAWPDVAEALARSRIGSNAQARAPPQSA